jgi:alpha-L-rhamnosidase
MARLLTRATFIFSFLLLYNLSFSQNPINVKIENQINPLGLEISKPNFSWEVKFSTKTGKQTGYQILVASTEENLKKDLGDIWNSKQVKSPLTSKIIYNGKAIEARKRYYYKIKIWNEKAKPSTWSETSYWEMGLLNTTDWTAKWIGKLGSEGKPAKAIDLQKEFTLSKRAIKARIYVAGLGAYFIGFNGKKIGDDRFGMGWRNFQNDIKYSIFEIDPDLLSVGTNFITAVVGNAWYTIEGSQNTGFKYSEGLNRLLFQMELTFYDGSIQTIATDGTWQVRHSPIIESALYNGEKYDASNEYNRDWTKADVLNDVPNKVTSFDFEKPKFVEQTTNFNTKDTKLVANQLTKNTIINELKAVAITEPKKGRFVFDFGENITGFTYIKSEGKVDKEIELKYAERLDNKGNVDQTTYKVIRPKDTYILKGYGVEEWESKFTRHTFRYVEVSGFPGKPTKDNIIIKLIPIGENNNLK